MRRTAALAALVAALFVVPAANAGGPTPIETRLGNAIQAVVICDTRPGWSSFQIVANRPVVTTWDLWCSSMERSVVGQRALDAGVVQGWYALATQQGKVACWHRLGNYPVCEDGEEVAAATAASRVPQIMRAAGSTKAKYIAKVTKAVQAMIDEGS